MSKEQAKKLAQQFIADQEKILVEYGDSVIKSRKSEAVASVQRVFQAIGTKPSTKSVAHAKS